MKINQNINYVTYIIVKQSRSIERHESNEYEFVTEVKSEESAQKILDRMSAEDKNNRYESYKKSTVLEIDSWRNGLSFKQEEEYKTW
jgi:hypothetical protein